jgi:putative ABC transport system permease protein
MLKDYFRFAWRNLIHKKLRSWLTLIGIIIGVTAVVSLISLGNGLRTAVNSQFGVSSTELISVRAGGFNAGGPPGTGVVNPLTSSDAEAIERLSRIDLTFERIVESIRIEYNRILQFGFAGNIPDGEKRNFVYESVELEPEIGRLLRDGDRNSVMVGYNFYADRIGFEQPVYPRKSIIINDQRYEVVGITKKTGSFIFDNIVWMNDDDLKSLLSEEDKDRVDVIGAKVRDSKEINFAREDVEELLRRRRGVKKGEEDFFVSTPESALSTINNILTGIQIFVVLIASISIFIGALGIINTMTTSVLERKNQIGIMKAIGAKNKDIFLQFFIESGLMGFIGGVIGVIIGVIIGYFGTIGINNFVGVEATPIINIYLVLFTLIGSFLIGAISGIIPAMKAAKENPVDALRG